MPGCLSTTCGCARSTNATEWERVAMPGIAELVDRGADLTALRLLARTDRSALAATLKELGYSKMGHRMELEKALLLDPPAEATGKPPAQAPGKPPAEALGKATAARVARLLVAEAEAAASAGRVAAAKRLWGQVAVLSPAHATERPRVDAEATRPLAEATAAAVVEAGNDIVLSNRKGGSYIMNKKDAGEDLSEEKGRHLRARRGV